MFCTKCGTEVPDGTKFCPTCGNQLESGATSASAATTSDYSTQTYGVESSTTGGYSSQVTGAYTAVEHPEYQKMGGWLLFFMIINIIAAVYSFVSVITSCSVTGEAMEMMAAFGMGDLQGIMMFSMVEMVVVAILELIFVYFVFSKNVSFLKFYQIVQILSIVLSVILIIAANSVFGNYGYTLAEAGINVAPSLVGGILGLILMTMYYCKSVRVRTYMGSTEYQKRALFRIGA